MGNHGIKLDRSTLRKNIGYRLSNYNKKLVDFDHINGLLDLSKFMFIPSEFIYEFVLHEMETDVYNHEELLDLYTNIYIKILKDKKLMIDFVYIDEKKAISFAGVCRGMFNEIDIQNPFINEKSISKLKERIFHISEEVTEVIDEIDKKDIDGFYEELIDIELVIKGTIDSLNLDQVKHSIIRKDKILYNLVERMRYIGD